VHAQLRAAGAGVNRKRLERIRRNRESAADRTSFTLDQVRRSLALVMAPHELPHAACSGRMIKEALVLSVL
jgi:hypothetical protein